MHRRADPAVERVPPLHPHEPSKPPDALAGRAVPVRGVRHPSQDEETEFLAGMWRICDIVDTCLRPTQRWQSQKASLVLLLNVWPASLMIARTGRALKLAGGCRMRGCDLPRVAAGARK